METNEFKFRDLENMFGFYHELLVATLKSHQKPLQIGSLITNKYTDCTISAATDKFVDTILPIVIARHMK